MCVMCKCLYQLQRSIYIEHREYRPIIQLYHRPVTAIVGIACQRKWSNYDVFLHSLLLSAVAETSKWTDLSD